MAEKSINIWIDKTKELGWGWGSGTLKKSQNITWDRRKIRMTEAYLVLTGRCDVQDTSIVIYWNGSETARIDWYPGEGGRTKTSKEDILSILSNGVNTVVAEFNKNAYSPFPAKFTFSLTLVLKYEAPEGGEPEEDPSTEPAPLKIPISTILQVASLGVGGVGLLYMLRKEEKKE